MPSTYSNIKIQLMATGENNTTWGDVTNVNLGTALEEAIVGSADVAFSNANVTLTLTDTNATQTARNMRLNLTGTATSGYNLVVPAIEKPYIVNNGTDGTITVKNSTGTGIAVPAGKTMWVYNNGTSVVDAVTHLSSLTLDTDLAVSQGGTGASTFTSNGVLLGNGTSAISATAAGTTGQVLVGNTGSAPTWATLTGTAVTSISFGTTGLTPSTATQGAVTVAGTLGVANGGTGTATTFTAGSVVFAGASGVYTQDNANLFWDNTNDRLGIGTSSPSSNGRLSVNGNIVLGPLTRNQAATQSVGVWSTGDPADDARANIGFTTVAGGASSSSYITFATNNYGVSGGERMRIDQSGNVGIGTSSPASLLDVAGTIRSGVGGSDPGTGAVFYFVGSGAFQTVVGGAAFAVNTGANNARTERMRIDSGGNVGIGTSAPASLLHAKLGSNAVEVYPTGTWAGRIINAVDGTANNGLMVGNRWSATNSFVVDFGSIYGNGSGSWSSYYKIDGVGQHFWGSGAAGTERMRLDSSGNVGIGTSSPSAKLDVIGSIYSRPGGSAGAIADLTADASSGANGISLAAGFASGGYGPIKLLTSATERVRIDSSGNVGIGTSAPGQTLQVVNASNYQFRLGAGSTFNYDIGRSGSDGFLYFYGNQSGFTGYVFSGADGERMRIDSNGNVSVGSGALATNATNGFLYIPTCAGTPTGTPTAKTGLAPMVVDSTNNKLYVYIGGAWQAMN